MKESWPGEFRAAHDPAEGQAMNDLFTLPDPVMLYPAHLYVDTPASIGAAVFKAMVLMGLFRGETVQRESCPGRQGLLNYAQELHREANDGATWPQIDTLGRELRHREQHDNVAGQKVGRQHVYDYLLKYDWRIVSDNGRVWCERVDMRPKPGQFPNPGHPCLPEQLR